MNKYRQLQAFFGSKKSELRVNRCNTKVQNPLNPKTAARPGPY